MSARDAAVRAVAEALHRDWYHDFEDPDGRCERACCPNDPASTVQAQVAMDALATSADVRAGLVVAIGQGWVDHADDVWPDGASEPEPNALLDFAVDAVLAALGGAADA